MAGNRLSDFMGHDTPSDHCFYNNDVMAFRLLRRLWQDDWYVRVELDGPTAQVGMRKWFGSGRGYCSAAVDSNSFAEALSHAAHEALTKWDEWTEEKHARGQGVPAE